MFVSTKAIVLKSIRYQEKSLIVKCYTETNGTVNFFVPSIFSSKKNSSKIAYFQPLNLLEIDFEHKKKSNLEYFKNFQQAYPSISNFDFKKNAILFFIAEVLDQVIKEQETDENLFHFLETSILWLNTHDLIHNFHLVFMLELTKFLGFYPDVSSISFDYFDLLEGKFNTQFNSFSITLEESNLFKKLIELKYSNENLIFSKTERQKLLIVLLTYFKHHNFEIKKTNSLEIFKELF